jgi:hypothetical protein
MRLSEVDAVLMMGMFAHERYGGAPIVGRSQILGSKGDPGLIPWVVTTPPFSAHCEQMRRSGHGVETVVVQDETLNSWNEDYIVFTEVFRRISEFNESHEESKIRTVAFDLEFLGFPRADRPTLAADANSVTVVPASAPANQFFNSMSSGGVLSSAQPLLNGIGNPAGNVNRRY